MNLKLASINSLSKQELDSLRGRLNQFYSSVSDYTAFTSPSDQVHCWNPIVTKIKDIITSGKQKVSILEVGAGRSGFGKFLVDQGVRNFCNWTAQDVNSQNVEWLTSQADHVVIGDIETLAFSENYDIVFSTFVLEHVTDPITHLEKLASLLRVNKGVLFIFSPRYDLPGYVTPSSKYFGMKNQMKFIGLSILARINTIISGHPAFLIQTDLAAFYQPFFTDADAVHWVSLFDLKSWAKSQGALTQPIKIGSPRLFSKDWVVKRFLTVGIVMKF